MHSNRRFFQPESEMEVESFVRQATKARQQLRAVGSALSPNGLGLSNEGTLSMALMDRILKVDKEKKQVRAERTAWPDNLQNTVTSLSLVSELNSCLK